MQPDPNQQLLRDYIISEHAKYSTPYTVIAGRIDLRPGQITRLLRGFTVRRDKAAAAVARLGLVPTVQPVAAADAPTAQQGEIAP